MATTNEYDAASIQVLQGLEAVRRRPGMYIGNTDDGSGMHHMLWEVLGNAVDEHLAGFAKHIRIDIDDHRITVEDDGRGIPPSAVELLFTTMHAGLHKPAHVHITPNLCGIGVPPVCALSRELEVAVWRDGHAHVQRFARGESCGPLEQRGASARRGTRVSFVPDFTILAAQPWDAALINARCRGLTTLLPGLVITFGGTAHHYPDGLVEALREGRDLVEPLHVRTTVDGITIDLAIGWHAGAPSIESFVNCSPTIRGVHVDALREATHATVARRFERSRIARSRVERHMVAIVHVMLAHPRFGSPSREWITNPEVGDAVRTVIERELARHFDEAPAALDSLLIQLQRRQRARRTTRPRA